MDQQTHLICETVQYITIDAWPAIYGKDNEHDLDSRDVLEEFRHWGEEFEKWWMSLPEDDREYKLDYQIEVEKFTEKKVAEYLKRFGESDLAILIRLVGETQPHDNYDFDIEDALAFADFFNNGGLEFTDEDRVHCAIVYAALYEGGRVEIGTWVWLDGEDFDEDAVFEVRSEDDFSASEIQKITDKIKSIYGQP